MSESFIYSHQYSYGRSYFLVQSDKTYKKDDLQTAMVFFINKRRKALLTSHFALLTLLNMDMKPKHDIHLPNMR